MLPYPKIVFLILCCTFVVGKVNKLNAQYSKNDTIFVSALIQPPDTFPHILCDEVYILAPFLDPTRRAELNRLRYNVHKVYPYAVTAAYLLDKVDREMDIRYKKKDRKAYLKALEKEMKNRFKDELKNLTITQGKILVKLINRETGRDCYSVLRDIKGGFNATIYQAAAKMFDNNLKNQYDPYGSDKDIEMIVQDIEAKNYYQYQLKLQALKKNADSK